MKGLFLAMKFYMSIQINKDFKIDSKNLKRKSRAALVEHLLPYY